MCGWFGVVAAVAGAGLSAYSSYQQGQTAKAAAEYNQEMQVRAAKDATARGAIAAAEHRDKVRRLIGEQAASFGASGVSLASGTPLKIMEETAGLGELDALRILNNAQREAAGYSAQSVLTDYEGKQAKKAGTISAGASLLSGASSAYYGYKKG